MKNILTLILIIVMATALISCHNGKQTSTNFTKEGPRHVEMKINDDGNYRFFVDDQEFYIKGAGCEFGDINALAAHGANSFRTWRTENGKQTAKEVLDEAHENGLMVMMGLDIARERHGFDYDDEAAVQDQFEAIKAEIIKCKDHPALLAWGIGNELNLRYTNKKVWNAVNDIAKMIKEIDGHHPTTTMLAGIGSSEVEYITTHCPDLDFISIQMYGDMINLQQRLEEAGYDGPYVVTEWGATGHWEVPSTKWQAAIEQTSTQKAASISERYNKAILVDQKYCMGSYVFLWGQKQERTPTWYGLFTEDGLETEAIDMMHHFWNGAWPVNRSPRVFEPTLNKQEATTSIVLKAGQDAEVNFRTSDPDEDPLTVKVEILRESTDLKDGGDYESRPESLEGLVKNTDLSAVEFNAPQEIGNYRIFVYVEDGNNHVATFNIPFRVTNEANAS